MARRWLIGLLVVAGALAGPLPAALAGTYSWPMPTTGTPGASNPDRDAYGASPWSYLDGTGFGQPPISPASLQLLGTFSTTIDGGLTGWFDAADPSADAPFVAANRSSALVGGEVPPGQLALQPAHDRVVAIGWTSPFTTSETVAVNGRLAPDDQALTCTSQPNWTLEAQDGTVIAGGGPTSTDTISASTTVPAGGAIYLIVGWSGFYSQSCTTAGLTLDIQAPAATPTISLSSPAAGQTISAAQPTFSGQASTRFGDSDSVTVHIWRGSAAGGTPVENLPARRSGSSYSAGASPPLANGTYTAQAEQDDLAGDVGLSAPVTFTIDNVAPKVTVNLLSTRPLLTSRPIISGSAGTRAGDSPTVYVGIWSGSSVGGTPLRYVSSTRAADGSWSVRIDPALPDGRYTVLAAQMGAGDVAGVSLPQTFRIKVHPPATSLQQPASGARLRPGSVVFGGRAGTALGDDPAVSLAIYRGRRTRGHPLTTLSVPVRGGRWRHRLRLRYPPGVYTVVARQADDAGHVTRLLHTIRLLAAPTVIAGPPELDASDRASLPVTCTASFGTCTGQVLVVTARDEQPVAGGPTGPARVLFGYVDAAAGDTVVVRRRVPGYVADMLRRQAPVRVRVTVRLTDSFGRAIDASSLSLLRIAR